MKFELGKPGIYRIYRRFLEPDGKTHMRLMGRFAIIVDLVHVLEDYDGVVSEMFPVGPLTGQILRRMNQMENSAHWHIVLEENIENGHHPEYLNETGGAPSNDPWVNKE